jgi:DNA adenine methylase
MKSIHTLSSDELRQTTFLPKKIEKVGVSPLKCQGIKTRLVRFIAESIAWHGRGRWIEPFLGSGVVLFNLAPPRALVADTNIHIIRFFSDIQRGVLDAATVRSHLEEGGRALRRHGQRFYNEVRDRFNRYSGSLDFLFLNRSCFNGVMRFNRDGGFNVPFGHKTDRFRPGYITKICNQVSWVQSVMRDKIWEFRATDWKSTLSEVGREDFVYADPPYIGRHTGYYNPWTEQEAEHLARTVRRLEGGFAVSMWKENRYRRNQHLQHHWGGLCEKSSTHFYHVGSREKLRNTMIEALVIAPGHVAGGEETE